MYFKSINLFKLKEAEVFGRKKSRPSIKNTRVCLQNIPKNYSQGPFELKGIIETIN